MHHSKIANRAYSTTSSASASSFAGISKPRLRGFAIKDKFELIYLLNRQLSRFNALKDSTHVNAAFVIAITEHRSIAH